MLKCSASLPQTTSINQGSRKALPSSEIVKDDTVALWSSCSENVCEKKPRSNFA